MAVSNPHPQPEPAAPVLFRKNRLTLVEWVGLLLLTSCLVGLPTIFVLGFRDDHRQHQRDQRLAAAGQPRTGRAVEAKPFSGGTRTYSPAWTKVLVELEPARFKQVVVGDYYDVGSELELLYLPDEDLCDGKRAVEGRLRQWPFTDLVKITLLAAVVCGGGLLVLWLHERWRSRRLP